MAVSEIITPGGAPPEIFTQFIKTGQRDGYLTGWLPTRLIDETDVPTNPTHVASLKKQFLREQEIQKREGIISSGQIDPLELAFPPGAKLGQTCDGYHRLVTTRELAIPLTLVTFSEIQRDWQYFYGRCIAATKDEYVTFPRMHRWLKKFWEYSPWSALIDIEQALAVYLRKDNRAIREVVDLDQRKAITEYIGTECQIWEKDPVKLYDHFQKVRGGSTRLIEMTRKGPARNGEKVIPIGHASRIAAIVRDEALQVAVAKETIRLGVSEETAGEIAMAISRKATTVEEAARLIQSGTWKEVTPTTSDFERRDQDFRRLKTLVTSQILQTFQEVSAKRKLSLKITPSTLGLLFGALEGSVADDIRTDSIQQTVANRPSDILGPNERLLLGLPLDIIQELNNMTFARHDFAVTLLNSLGFTNYFDNQRELTMRTTQNGKLMATLAHNKEPMVARCFGARLGTRFSVSDIYLVYAEGYKGKIISNTEIATQPSTEVKKNDTNRLTQLKDSQRDIDPQTGKPKWVKLLADYQHNSTYRSTELGLSVRFIVPVRDKNIEYALVRNIDTGELHKIPAQQLIDLFNEV